MVANPKGSAAPAAPSYAFIDALRGIAALIVVLFHQQIHVFLGFPEKRIPPGSFTWWVFLGFFDLGKYAVVVFFMVSGFLIPATLRRPGATIGRFARHRFFRLYPAYWFAIALHAGTLAAIGSPSGLDWSWIAVNLTMFQKFLGRQDFIGVFWTLQIEMTFYVLCAALFRFGILAHRSWAQWGCIAAALACAALRWQTGKALPVALFLALVVMFAGDVLRAHDEGIASRREVATALAVAACTVVPAAWMGYRDEATRYILTYWAGIATFALCWRNARAFEGGGFVRRCFSFLGSISYGVYLLGSTVLLALGGPVFAATGNAWLATVVDVSVTIGLAWICLRCIELPAIRFGRRSEAKFPT